MLEASGVRMLYIEVESKTLINGLDLKRNAALNIINSPAKQQQGDRIRDSFRKWSFYHSVSEQRHKKVKYLSCFSGLCVEGIKNGKSILTGSIRDKEPKNVMNFF